MLHHFGKQAACNSARANTCANPMCESIAEALPCEYLRYKPTLPWHQQLNCKLLGTSCGDAFSSAVGYCRSSCMLRSPCMPCSNAAGEINSRTSISRGNACAVLPCRHEVHSMLTFSFQLLFVSFAAHRLVWKYKSLIHPAACSAPRQGKQAQ